MIEVENDVKKEGVNINFTIGNQLDMPKKTGPAPTAFDRNGFRPQLCGCLDLSDQVLRIQCMHRHFSTSHHV